MNRIYNEKVTVCYAFSAESVIGPHSFEDDNGTSITSDRYAGKLRTIFETNVNDSEDFWDE